MLLCIHSRTKDLAAFYEDSILPLHFTFFSENEHYIKTCHPNEITLYVKLCELTFCTLAQRSSKGAFFPTHQKHRLGEVLLQVDGEVLHLVAYASIKLKLSEEKYLATESGMSAGVSHQEVLFVFFMGIAS